MPPAFPLCGRLRMHFYFGAPLDGGRRRATFAARQAGDLGRVLIPISILIIRKGEPSVEGLAAGPLVLTGRPGVPAPEFAPLGVETDGAAGAFCVKAGAVTNGSSAKRARARIVVSSIFWSPEWATALKVGRSTPRCRRGRSVAPPEGPAALVIDTRGHLGRTRTTCRRLGASCQSQTARSVALELLGHSRIVIADFCNKIGTKRRN